MTPGPLTVEDRIAIDDLFAAYAWSADRGRMEPFLALFTHDARIVDPVYGPYEGPDRAGPRRFLELMHENHTFPGRQHWVGQLLLEGDTERCAARSFVMVTSLHRTGATNVHLVAWYQDVLLKVDGSWLISERVIRPWRGDVLQRFPELAGPQ